MRVLINGISKSFGATRVLDNISLEVEPHELFFLLGPSGCGKTTLLRLIAGFYQADEGTLQFGEKIMNGIPPNQRNTGMVFQNYALWPHLTVAANVAYGLDVRGIEKGEKDRRVLEALEVVQMVPYARRTPNQLSGGQQQRVALARALVIKPDLLLLDEPLSNLDARLRLEMRQEIRRIHQQTRITTIYVTHDQKESLSLADHIAVMHQGRVEQVGSPREIYRNPRTRFVAEFLGEINWLEGIVRETATDEVVVGAEATVFRVNREQIQGDWSADPGVTVWIGFRPETASLDGNHPNALAAEIVGITYLGETEEYQLRVASGRHIKVFEQNPVAQRQAGTIQKVHVRPHDIFLFKKIE